VLRVKAVHLDHRLMQPIAASSPIQRFIREPPPETADPVFFARTLAFVRAVVGKRVRGGSGQLDIVEHACERPRHDT
jgi:hypothetical protein